MMTLEEMKLAVCEKLPDVIEIVCHDSYTKVYMAYWKPYREATSISIQWPTEGLQVCHEAEKLLDGRGQDMYASILGHLTGGRQIDFGACLVKATTTVVSATYEQRLEALCRVWWPERFTK